MEFVHLDEVVMHNVKAGMKCIDIGAFSGVYAKMFVAVGAAAVAVEALPASVEELRKRIGRRCEVLPALFADDRRPYSITNKTEIRMIGDAPVFEPSSAAIVDIESTTYDATFGDKDQPDFVKISGRHVCEALLGAHTLLTSKSSIAFVMDQRYLPARHRHDEFCLYDLLRRSGRSIYSCAGYVAGDRPLTVWEFTKRATHGWKTFIAVA
ncbi:hypothetical protein [Rhodopseudomonas sp.]|uniref:hypothetical protein n=1 Tax=Rhodopseudomonas sp. TaxID=1078 RepID=UPI003B3AC737